MLRRKNKTLFFVILGFVFLFLASQWPDAKTTEQGKNNPSSAAKTSETKPVAKEAAGVSVVAAASSTAPAAPSAAVPVPAVKGEKIKAPLNNAAPSTTSTHPSFAPQGGATEGKPAFQMPGDNYYQVVKVVDGDTIDINLNGKTERLRLIGLNTPEVVDPRKTVECFGREASDNAKKLLAGQKVRIAADPSQDDRDKYGRLLRYVWLADGLFYNLEAIKAGFAYEYTYNIPYQYQKEFKAAQKYAQENYLGLWADGACGKSNLNSTGISLTKGDCFIKGNIGSTGEKIYHLPDCPYYNQTVIDESKGEKWFCFETEALAAGWRKALNCP